MKNSVYISIVCLSFLLVSVIIDNAFCNPQLTFSSDWSGGKRELENSKMINLKNVDSNGNFFYLIIFKALFQSFFLFREKLCIIR